jgi:putative endonuclease
MTTYWNRRAKGKNLEERACNYLKSIDYEIVERNYFTRYGEIDIIAKKSETFIFIEVRSLNKNEPFETINDRKLEHLEKAIKIYVDENNIENWKVEFIIFLNDNKIEHITSL